MNKQNQYQQNLEIINSFFKKKITLFTGIFSILFAFSFFIAFSYIKDVFNSNILTFLSEFMTSNSSLSPLVKSVFFLLMLLVTLFTSIFGIIFIILHYFSKDISRNTNRIIKILKNISLVYTFFSCFSLFFFTCLATLNLFLFLNYSLFPILAFIFLSFIFSIFIKFYRFFFFRSLYKSVNSIYLYKKGVTVFGILSIITALFSFVTLSGMVIYSIITNYKLLTLFIPIILFLLFLTICKASWSLYAFCYSKFIKDVVYGKVKLNELTQSSTLSIQFDEELETTIKNTLSKNNELSPEKNISSNTSDIDFSQIDLPPRTPDISSELKINFSNSVFKDEPETPVSIKFDSLNKATPEAENNSDLSAETTFSSLFKDPAPSLDLSFDDLITNQGSSTTFSCPDCGATYTSEDIYCNVCGKKLI